MKISKLKEIFEDESLKYALATNIAKYGRPQSKKSDKKAKLTKGLEKKREKVVKDLKKSMDEKVDLVHVTDKDGKMFGTGERVKDSNGTTTVRFDAETTKDFPTSQVKNVKEQDMGSSFPGEAPSKGYTVARELIATLRKEVYPKLNDDELEEFGTEMHDHFMAYMKESVNENKSGLDRIKFYFDKLYGPDLRFNINRDPNNPERDRIDVRGSQQDLMDFGSALQGQEMEGYEVFWTDDDDRGQIVRIVKSDSIMREKKDKVDRCLRIARRKMPKTSAYRSGLVVKCRKGMIWKKEK
jgi:hypothetical protein